MGMNPSLVTSAREASTNEIRKITMVGGLSLMTRTPQWPARNLASCAHPKANASLFARQGEAQRERLAASVSPPLWRRTASKRSEHPLGRAVRCRAVRRSYEADEPAVAGAPVAAGDGDLALGSLAGVDPGHARRELGNRDHLEDALAAAGCNRDEVADRNAERRWGRPADRLAPPP